MVFTKIYRHGDVILYKIAEEPLQKLIITHKQNKLTLAEGEVTGHSHQLTGDFEILEQKSTGNELTFIVNTTALLTHEEHDKIVLDKGTYIKVNQVEYDPFTDLVKKVTD